MRILIMDINRRRAVSGAMDRNEDCLAELLAQVADDPEATAAITAAWQDIQQQVTFLEGQGINVAIAFDHEGNKFVVDVVKVARH
jgi:hypothetical protein